MSNFSVNGVYSYSRSNIYSYLGRIPTNEETLRRAFSEFHVAQTGNEKTDLQKLDNAMYAVYSHQVQEQIANQNSKKVIPWEGLMAQIGVKATGNREKDYAAFNSAIQLLSQGAIDGQAMAYFAGLKSEAAKVFGEDTQQGGKQVTFDQYKAYYLR